MRSFRKIVRSRWTPLIGVAFAASFMAYPAVSSASTTAWAGPGHVDCSNGNRFLCTEVANNQQAFGRGHYVGHDEPSLLYYSKAAGSGNEMEYSGILPYEPAPNNIPGAASYDFELTPAIWFGMAMCDTQSYPETVRTCIPDSDANIVPATSPYHPGAAYMELQFYPPGYVEQWRGSSCSPTQWCVALTIDSYSLDPVTGQSLNQTCQAVTGIEYVNFAFLTHNGVPAGPPNPVQFDPKTSGTPNAKKTFFLNQGDHYTVTMHDTTHGLQTVVHDLTTGQSGSMTASAANGFGQVKFAPTGSSCTNIPYNFHPMYSTSGPDTTVPWAAATYNVAYDTEIGHFDYCSQAVQVTFYGGSCKGTEGAASNLRPSDGDDYACFPAAASSLIKITGCEGSNIGYDGTPYLKDWPNGTSSTPTPTIVTSPLTGPSYNTQYTQVAFNTDLPNIEGQLGTCNQKTGAGCNHIPTSDSGAPAQFYPYYTSGPALGGCAWAIGQDVPGFTTADYGQNAQYGALQKVTYTTTGGGHATFIEDYNHVLSNNPCPAPTP